MKIAIVCYPTFGGSGVVATELGISLAKRGHEIHFVTYKQPVRLDYLTHNIHYHEVIVPEYPLFHYQPYELALSSKLVTVIKKFEIDILHVHYAIPHAYAGFMAQQMLLEEDIHIPMMTTLHGTDITLVGSHNFYKPAVNFSINKSDAVTSVSDSLKSDTLRIFDIKNEIHVIPNFIDMKNLQKDFENCKRHLMANEDERIITHVSNLRQVKRIDHVIEVFHKIQKEVKAKLIIIGDGPERENASKLAHELGVRDSIIFLGKSNEIERILCFSDLFLLPSEKESFGLAALEAMAHGVPVIASNAGGLPEVIVNNESGFLCEIGDVDAMATHGISLLKDDDKLEKFKTNAETQAWKFDIEEVVPMYEKLYLQMKHSTK
ncbi:N-acetyl-alpha-D-glucosaminyl L-malate synthase BshA [Psychroflexus planctonicus]|uniref:N-acetyl-alpha-D-glucosaminyl L-malate synthase BshA n=1 Tax=Psychroflexus planctonicus TaxID=1526575 RepID=A0ABQ1SFR4_9FLAO|nr:N-acetyl-alpha-D-glucosaminyl L-malate synthase BshA [Psychroflexus planctonicus]GGE27056.1 N-acetyl-alpha-D-glucosaminyl L-malate synthase BshA [Psychroflexus planctonicus]